MTITPEEIAEWREVCEGATEEPWASEDWSIYDADRVEIARTETIVDSEFITTARTAMPRLLDELAAKDALIAKYEATLSEIVSVYGNDMDAVVESMMRKQNKALQAPEES